MGILDSLGGGFGIGSLILGGTSAISGAYQGVQNLKAQREANATNIDLAKNSVLYRTQDLKNAGLNPLLAAGQSMQLPAIKAASMDFDPAAKALVGVQAAQQAATTAAQQRVLDMQADKLKAETIGQDIQNQFAAQLAGNQVEAGSLANAFNRLANPANLEALTLANKGKNLANIGAQLDNELKNLGIDNAQINLVRNKIGVTADRLGLTQQELDIAAKKIAIKIGRIDANTKQWDLNYRYRTGQQPSGNPSVVNRFLNDANTLGTGVRVGIWTLWR